MPECTMSFYPCSDTVSFGEEMQVQSTEGHHHVQLGLLQHGIHVRCFSQACMAAHLRMVFKGTYTNTVRSIITVSGVGG